jgi:3'(2'), 5'-bisphosphate nucleotidase
MSIETYTLSPKYLSLMQLVKEVGCEILKVYDKEFKTTIKSDNSPVTEADHLANDLILKHLKLHFPDYGIISEETEENSETYKKENIFVIDPIDGTKGFVAKSDDFAIMIGILKDFKPYFGIVYEPVNKRLYFAQDGFGSFLELSSGKILTLKTSRINNFENARMFRSKNHFSKNDKLLTEFLNLPEFKSIGSIGVKSGRIASQENEIYINMSGCLGKWDACAPQVIIEQAGGEVFDKFGLPLNYSKINEKMINGFIGTNGKLDRREILGCVLKIEFMKDGKNCYDKKTWK